MAMPPTTLAHLLWQHDTQTLLRSAPVTCLRSVRMADPFAYVASLRARPPASISQLLFCSLHGFGELPSLWQIYVISLEQKVNMVTWHDVTQ